jgi:hypothetical protein
VRVYKIPEPEYAASVPREVAEEAKAAWLLGRPWTKIRKLRGAAEGLGEAICIGAPRQPDICGEDATHVQYSSAFGDPLTYCAKCAREAAEWDEVLYASCKPHGHEYDGHDDGGSSGKTLLELIHGVKKVSDMTPDELDEHRRRKREEREDDE